MTLFKVGDRVERIRCINSNDKGKFYPGEKGTVISLNGNWPYVVVDGKGCTILNDPLYLKLISTKEETKMENKYTTTVTKLNDIKSSFNSHDGQIGYITTSSEGTVLINMYNRLNKADATRLISELNSILPHLK